MKNKCCYVCYVKIISKIGVKVLLEGREEQKYHFEAFKEEKLYWKTNQSYSFSDISYLEGEN